MLPRGARPKGGVKVRTPPAQTRLWVQAKRSPLPGLLWPRSPPAQGENGYVQEAVSGRCSVYGESKKWRNAARSTAPEGAGPRCRGRLEALPLFADRVQAKRVHTHDRYLVGVSCFRFCLIDGQIVSALGLSSSSVVPGHALFHSVALVVGCGCSATRKTTGELIAPTANIRLSCK